MNIYKDEREFLEKDQKADKAAQDRGYKDAEEAQALREVELEWYFKTYGTKDPVEVLAYQRIERKKYGTTTYEAALAGQQLIEIGSLEQEEVRREASTEVDQISSDIAVAEEANKKKLMLIGGGVLVAGILGFMFLRGK